MPHSTVTYRLYVHEGTRQFGPRIRTVDIPSHTGTAPTTAIVAGALLLPLAIVIMPKIGVIEAKWPQVKR